MKEYQIKGMSCAACQAHVEKAVNSLDGVKKCNVSLLTNSMQVEGDVSDEMIIKAVRKAGYDVENKNSNTISFDSEIASLKKRLFYSLIFLFLLMYITMLHNMLHLPLALLENNPLAITLTQLLLTLVVLAINIKFFISGFKSLFNKAPNMDTLVALGSSISFIWSLYITYKMTYLAMINDIEGINFLMHHHLYYETAAMIPTLITVGKLMEAISKGHTSDALKELIKMSPNKATLLIDNQEKEVNINEVKIGDYFIVKTGDNIPLDGIVVKGNGTVNESILTGESLPIDKNIDDEVSAGTFNLNGYMICKVTKNNEDTTLSKIIKLVKDAASSKAPIARKADKVASVFVPFVIIISLIVFIMWYILGHDIELALEKATTCLVISCPCALGLATPTAIMVGSGIGFKNGILFKTAEAIENVGEAKIVALDKTGTITKGETKVKAIYPNKISENELLIKAYSLENKSEHPLAKAIKEEALKRNIELIDNEEFEVLSGSGLKAKIAGKVLQAGSYRYISSLIEINDEFKTLYDNLSQNGETPLFFIEDKELLGIISVADEIKEDSKEAIKQFHNMGLKVYMLTGDNEKTAKAIAKEAGVDEYYAEIRPIEKEAIIRKLSSFGKVIMIGDGINDAPALTKADIGIAIGAGNDIAIDSADIVLVNSKLSDAASALRLSKQTIKNIYENLFWAFFYNMICIPLAAGLYQYIFNFKFDMNPMIGAATMALSSVTVCLNALRLNLFNIHDSKKDHPSKLFKKEKKKMVKTIKIEGMMCMHCEASVKKALEAIDGITVNEVSHEKGIAIISLTKDIADELIIKAIEDKDYKVVSII